MLDQNSSAPSESTTETGNNPRSRFLRPVQKTTEADSSPIHTTDYTAPRSTVRQLYAIIDSVTDSIVGGIQIHMNHQSAIRTLYDVAVGDTMVNKHPLDFDLWLLGALGADHRINVLKQKLISGAQIEEMVKSYAAAQSPTPRRTEA